MISVAGVVQSTWCKRIKGRQSRGGRARRGDSPNLTSLLDVILEKSDHVPSSILCFIRWGIKGVGSDFFTNNLIIIILSLVLQVISFIHIVPKR